MGGAFSIFVNLKKGGLSGRAYPYTFSMGVPPPPGMFGRYGLVVLDPTRAAALLVVIVYIYFIGL